MRDCLCAEILSYDIPACSKKVLTVTLMVDIGWAGMNFSAMISELDSYLKKEEKKREALRRLLVNNVISRDTYDAIDGRISRVASIISELKEVLTAEEIFWKANLSEEIRVLETLLVELEHRRLLGEIGDEEWERKSRIIGLGLNALRTDGSSLINPVQKPAPPTQITLEKIIKTENAATLSENPETGVPRFPEGANKRQEPSKERINVGDDFFLSKREQLLAKEPPEFESAAVSAVRCMNPWKPDCTSTDIKLSIYYKGHMIPICRRCWEEIADKNIEWSSP